MKNYTKYYTIAYYSLIGAGILFILFSNPFLIKDYDPWRHHLQNIASFYNNRSGEGSLCLWHKMWANVFKFSGINNIFIWAKIIHVLQFFFAAVIMLYFSKTALTILTNEKENIRIKFFSLFSVFLWFIGNGTFSDAYQQAWIMWYSVTYQGLTIPLFWYCTALTLKVFYTELTPKRKIFYIAQIVIASLFIVRVHPSEFLYYFIILSVIMLFSIKKILLMKNKKVLFFSILIVLLIIFIAIRYLLPVQVPLFKLMVSDNTMLQKFQQIKSLGNEIVSHLNRFPNSFSEIALLSLVAGLLFRILYMLREEKKSPLNLNCFDCILISSLIFFMIPTVPFFAGFIGYLTDKIVVWRFFFASPWFLLFPFLLFKVLTFKEINLPTYKFIIAFIITGITILFVMLNFHKYFFHDTLNRNIKSITASLDKNKVGIQY